MRLVKGNGNNFKYGKEMATDNNTFEKLISKKELVLVFGISSSFVNKLMAEEGLPHFKIGRAVRYRVSDISMWLELRRIS